MPKGCLTRPARSASAGEIAYSAKAKSIEDSVPSSPISQKACAWTVKFSAGEAVTPSENSIVSQVPSSLPLM